MTKESLERANWLKSEIEFISTERLPALNDAHYEVIKYRDKGDKEIDVDFFFDRTNFPYAHCVSTIVTIENVLNFIEIEIKTMIEYKKCLEKELEEL